MYPLVPQSFYAREALEVAIDLIGKLLCRDDVELRITEVEAYRFPDDTANHCRVGRTARNAAMWGPPGHAYVYLCYGMHNLLNLVTDADNKGAAVLVRGCEPVAGLETIRARRGNLNGPVLLTGPGKVGAALGLDAGWSRHALFAEGDLTLREGPAPAALLRGPRVGIDYASPRDIRAPWRIAAADTPWVSQRATLRRFGR